MCEFYRADEMILSDKLKGTLNSGKRLHSFGISFLTLHARAQSQSYSNSKILHTVSGGLTSFAPSIVYGVVDPTPHLRLHTRSRST